MAKQETPEMTSKQQTPEATCPNCGMPQSAWQGNDGKGFQMGDKTYCCQGCAVGTGCTCK